MQRVHILFVVAWYVLAINTGLVTSSYVETGECDGEQLCTYFYSAQQDYINSGDMQRTSVNATVDITCTSSGVYNQSDAKLYCMALKQPNIYTNAMENSTDRERRTIQQSIAEQLGNWFCFVQSRNGKIPAVYHQQSEPDHVVGLKKSIAAAFQANFEGTDEEEEVDPQSRHKSHYTYTQTDEEGLLKMQRRISKEDVSEYSTEEPSDDIDTEQDEEVLYRSGRLEWSSGNTTVHLVNSSTGLELNSLSLSQALAATGSYKMELRTCRRIGKYVYGAQKRRILSEIGGNSKEEDLKATIDKKKADNAEMKRLRDKLPSGSVLEALQSYEVFGDEIVPVLQALMELESQYGVLATHTSVLDDIMAFISHMPNSESDRKVREAVLMLLSVEGSLRSQMALLNAYDNAMDDDETNVILTHISFMSTVRIGFVIGMEERLARHAEDTFLSHQFLLVFSSLATKGSDEVEDRVMNVLSTRITSLRSQPDMSEVDLMLRALGNTGSKLSIPLIFSFLDLDNDQVKLAAIDALGKVADDPAVLSRLEHLLQEDPSDECAAAVIETLQTGFQYAKKMQRDMDQYSSLIRSHSLLYTLAEAVSFSNSTELHLMMAAYLKKVNADDIIFDLIYNDNSLLGSRGKRGTTDWDSSRNSDYNYVESLVNRRNQVNTYNRHSAYLNSKTIGINEANVKIAYGYFAGTNTRCDQMKAFGRCIVVGTLLSKTVTIADVKFDIQASTTDNTLPAYVMAFVKIGSNTLLQHDRPYQHSLSSHCERYNHPIREYRQRIFRLRYNIFVYAGYLTLSVDLTAHFNLDVNANICIGRTGTEDTGALGAITPTAGLTISGGVSGNILEVARGGIQVSASFNYRLEPTASIQGCAGVCEVCIGIYDSQPPSRLRLETWYQTRSVRTCGSGWFRYPCVRWGRRRTVDSLSASWNLGSQPRRALRKRCQGSRPTCAASQLFSY